MTTQIPPREILSNPPPLRVLDLFSGIGGFSLGLERAGMQTTAFCEIDSYCRKVLAKHWGGIKIHHDVTKLDGNQYAGTIDVICGGDPCQANSNARTHGKTPDSPADHFIRIVAECRPRIVLRENPSVVRKDAPWPWRRFRDALESLGYIVLPFRIRACCTGLDCRRERLLLLATLPIPECEGLEGHVSQIMAGKIEGGQDTDPARSDRWHPTPRICRGSDGIPNRVDRLKSLGNAFPPSMSERIGRAIVKYDRNISKTG
jgi:DNA (cytosine-5)-methyltransferase 1